MHRLRTKLFQSYFRLSRGLTLGAMAAVSRVGENADDTPEVLLVSHGYRPGWHFPGGGVEWNETLLEALYRELAEETGVVPQGEPRLHGIFSNFKAFPGDHIGLFVVENWSQPSEPPLGFEIRDRQWFRVDALPDGTTLGVRKRVDELFFDAPLSPHWGGTLDGDGDDP